MSKEYFLAFNCTLLGKGHEIDFSSWIMRWHINPHTGPGPKDRDLYKHTERLSGCRVAQTSMVRAQSDDSITDSGIGLGLGE